MGQTLSSPATDKHSTTGQNKRFMYAVSEMQGWRISMEDAHANILNLDEGIDEESNSFFAVYDGHGGGTVARFAGQNVHKRLVSEESYRAKQYQEALKRAYLGTDEDLLANPAHTRDPSGCTAVSALVTPDNKIYVANAGDSRSVLSSKGDVKALSFDHKPNNETEKSRITKAGGYVEYGRVNGNLALSRAIGDFEFKKNYSLIPEQQVITSDPDVTVHEITEEDEFFVLACDGIWDCLSSQAVVDFIRRRVAEGVPLAQIGESICEHCLAPDTSSGAGTGCDNMTVMIIAILHGRTSEEWYSWVTDRVNQNYGHDTPAQISPIYSKSRLMAFKARQEALAERERKRKIWQKEREERMQEQRQIMEERERLEEEMRAKAANSNPEETKVEEVKPDAQDNNDDDDDGDGGGQEGFLSATGFARVLGSTGGISFSPGSGIMSDTGTLMFGNADDGDDSDDDDGGISRSFYSETLGMGGPAADATENLKAKIDEFEKDIHAEGESHPKVQGEAPPPPLPNGDSSPVSQLKSKPGGDEPSPAVKAEGLLDKSEDPLKV